MDELDIRRNAKQSPVLPSHTEWWDKIIGEQVGDTFGTSGGVWINISGVPGSGKTLILLDVLNGFAQNKNCVVDHFDFETGRNRLVKYLKLVGSTNIHNMLGGVPQAVLPRMTRMIQECADQNKFYIASIDSLNEFTHNDVKEARKVAEALHKLREHPNFILFSIAHLMKGRKAIMAGPAQFARLSDVNMMINVMDVYRIVSTPEKNRLSTGNNEPVKLYLKAGEGWQESAEPDFITNNGIVQFFRKWL